MSIPCAEASNQTGKKSYPRKKRLSASWGSIRGLPWTTQYDSDVMNRGVFTRPPWCRETLVFRTAIRLIIFVFPNWHLDNRFLGPLFGITQTPITWKEIPPIQRHYLFLYLSSQLLHSTVADSLGNLIKEKHLHTITQTLFIILVSFYIQGCADLICAFITIKLILS